jgi:hypothetical protein
MANPESELGSKQSFVEEFMGTHNKRVYVCLFAAGMMISPLLLSGTCSTTPIKDRIRVSTPITTEHRAPEPEATPGYQVVVRQP